MLVAACPYCHAIVVSPNHLRGTVTPCPNCTQPYQVRNDQLSDVDLRALVSHRETEHGGNDTITGRSK